MDHSNLWTDITGEGPHVCKTLQKFPFCVPLGRQRGTVGHHSGGKVPSFHYKCITTLCTAAPQHTAGVLLISFTPAPQISQVIHCLSHTRGHDQSLMYKNIDCHFNWNHWPVIQSSKTLILEYWLRIVLRAYDRADKYNNHDKRVNESVPRCASHPFLSSTSPPPVSQHRVSTELYSCWVHINRMLICNSYMVCVCNCANVSDGWMDLQHRDDKGWNQITAKLDEM